MEFLILGLRAILGIVGLVCFVMVLIKMFQSGDTTLGIICIVLALCFGIGVLIAFIFGWVNATKWDIKNLMWIWTGAIVAGLILGVIGLSFGAPMLPVQR